MEKNNTLAMIATQVVHHIHSRVPLIWVVTRDSTNTAAFISSAISKYLMTVTYWNPMLRLTDKMIYTLESDPEMIEGDTSREQSGPSAYLNQGRQVRRLSSELRNWMKTAIEADRDPNAKMRRGDILMLLNAENEIDNTVVDTIRTIEEYCRLLRYGTDKTKRGGGYRSIVLITQNHKVPEFLHPMTVVVNFPTPDREQVTSVVEDVIDNITKRKEPYPFTDGKKSKESYDETEKKKIIDSCLGLSHGEMVSAMLYSINEVGHLEPQIVQEQKRQAIRRDDVLDVVDNVIDVSEIGGLDNVKHWLQMQKATFTPQGLAFGATMPSGLLTVGVPGSGKSMLSRAISSIFGLHLLRLDVGKLMQGIIGSSEERTRRALALAIDVSPVVLWIDEIEKSLSGGASSGNSDAGTTARVFGTLLTWIFSDVPMVCIA